MTASARRLEAHALAGTRSALAVLLTGCAASVPAATTPHLEVSVEHAVADPTPPTPSSARPPAASPAALAVSAIPALSAAGRVPLTPPAFVFEPSSEPVGYATRNVCYQVEDPFLHGDEICVTALGAYRERDGAWEFVAAIPLETREEIEVPSSGGRPCGYWTSVRTRWEILGGRSCVEIRGARSRMTSGTWCEGEAPRGYCGSGHRLRYEDAPTEIPETSDWFWYARGVVPDLRGAWELGDTRWRRVEHCEGPLEPLGSGR